MTEISKKNADRLDHGDLILLCEQEGIKVEDKDNRYTLIEKLNPKKPKPKK